jgi:Protein of unknown function (DUF3489)
VNAVVSHLIERPAMNAKPPLTNAQRTVLEHAAQNTQGRIEWFPDHIKGGARQKMLQGINNRDLIIQKSHCWQITASGYNAISMPQLTPTRTLQNSKQAQVIDMLKRPQGTTIEEITQVTAWQAHTVRGFFSAALKKKLGLTIISSKPDGATRSYRIDQGFKINSSRINS